jgi:hypothetical protein
MQFYRTDRSAQSFPAIKWTEKYWAVLRTQLHNSFAYPLDLLARSVTILLFLWVFVNLWRVTYRAMGSQQILENQSPFGDGISGCFPPASRWNDAE